MAEVQSAGSKRPFSEIDEKSTESKGPTPIAAFTQVKMPEIKDYGQYDAEEKRRIERRDYERGRAEKRKKQKQAAIEREKEEAEEKERERWAARPIPKPFLEIKEAEKDTSEVIYAKKFVKHGKCFSTAEAVAKFRQVCNKNVFVEKQPELHFVDQVLEFFQKARRCFFTGEDDFSNQDQGKNDVAIREHFKTQKGMLGHPEAKWTTFCGLEFKVTFEDFKKMKYHYVCCDDCVKERIFGSGSPSQGQITTM